MPPTATPEPDDFSDSDREWYDRLGPGPHPPARTPAEHEGDALRQAVRAADAELLARPEVQAALGDEARRARLQEVKARLVRQETPAPAAPGGWQRLRAWIDDLRPRRPWPAVAALALAVVAGTVIVPVWMNERVYDLPGELRGADDVRRLAVEHPRRAADAFADELARAGLEPGRFQRGKTFIVDVDVEPPQLPAATPAFTRVGLEPRLGFTRVEFAPRP